MQRIFAILLTAALVLAVAGTACGDDDSGGKTTPSPATPGAQATAAKTGTTASGDSGADYRTKAQAAAAKLAKAAQGAVQDMQSAQLSQNDAKWPGILGADADAITAGATERKALTPPAGALTDASKKLNAAADRLSEGAKALKKSVDSGDQGAGAQAFLAFNDGRSQLNDAVAALK